MNKAAKLQSSYSVNNLNLNSASENTSQLISVGDKTYERINKKIDTVIWNIVNKLEQDNTGKLSSRS